MTQFTQNLGQPSSPARPVDPGPATPSVLSGMGNVLNAISSHVQRRNVENRQQQEALEASRQAQTEDTVASMFMESLYERERQLQGTGAVELADQMEMRAEGVAQGNMSQSSFDLRLETDVMRFLRDNPDQSAEFVDYMQARGFDSYLFRNIQAAQSEEEARLNARNEQRAEAYQWAVSNLDPELTQNRSYEELAQMGQQGIVLENQREQLRQLNMEARERAELGSQISQREQDELNQQSLSWAISNGVTRLRPVTTEFQQLWRDNPDDREFLRGTIPEITSAIMQEYSRIEAEAAEAGLATPEMLAELQRFRDDVIGGFTLFTENPTFDGVRGDYLNRLGTELEIDFAETAPTLYRLSQASETATAMLVDMTLASGNADLSVASAEMQAYLRGETSPRTMEVHTNLVQRAAERVGTEDSEEAIGAYISRLNGVGRALGGEEPSSELINQYSQDLVDWVALSSDVNVPGQMNSADFLGTTAMLYGETRIREMERLYELNPAGAQSAIGAMTAEAERLLRIGRGIMPTGLSGWSVRYDEASGQYQPELVSNVGAPMSALERRSGTGVSAAEARSRAVPPASVTDQARGLNTLLTWLVGMDQIRDDTYGLSARDLRNAYATGQRPERPESREEENPEQPRENGGQGKGPFNKAGSSLKEEEREEEQRIDAEILDLIGFNRAPPNVTAAALSYTDETNTYIDDRSARYTVSGTYMPVGGGSPRTNDTIRRIFEGRSNMFGPGTLNSARSGSTIAHELVHRLFDVRPVNSDEGFETAVREYVEYAGGSIPENFDFNRILRTRSTDANAAEQLPHLLGGYVSSTDRVLNFFGLADRRERFPHPVINGIARPGYTDGSSLMEWARDNDALDPEYDQRRNRERALRAAVLKNLDRLYREQMTAADWERIDRDYPPSQETGRGRPTSD